ncbi:TPA: peptidoglycan hydrolase [Streptococcus equi subsp. zooepidemicus]|nr:peptidoglycan hydrolase [Streptococcus equi subsp. zooepidemicus]HEL0428354.1 peptidoglycan hydrolase [Streptococcus equi subsp. zooepidemicus]HEL0430505.1 peptidoglycan hydrolase [Streptococcus equi subsp. zooepidemicus]HEL0438596.1 peptidoglycan hydrolase [Streptococcus equi subsp. zooepidemicus]
MNTDVLINWFESRRGKLTYSMYGSRNGSDGTADCSGSISQALKEAGVNIIGLPSTVTLGSQLANNGFYRVSKNEDWNGQRGDIILMSWGADMSQSGGAGGHVGVLEDANTFISVDYWTGGQVGTAVSSHNWDQYYAIEKPAYIEAWRFSGSTAKQPNTVVSGGRKPDSKAYYQANAVAFVNGIYQIKCDYLAPVGFDWTDNGIPVGLVNWVDENGNNLPDGHDKDFKAGMYFSFEIDEAHITDTGEGGYYGGYYWRKFEFGQFGTVWLSCRDKDDLVNYYN